MIPDNEWQIISAKAFPKTEAKAPAFMWTRILASIESEELRQASAWWMQWRWMGRVTVAAALLMSLGTFYMLQHAAVPLEVALEGRSSQHQAIQLASADGSASEESAALVVGLDS